MADRHFSVTRLPGFGPVAVAVFVALYLPIATLVVYSFNAGQSVTAWGGWSNGTIPSTALCSIARGHALRCDAAAGYAALADAYRAAFGSPLCITDSYRSLGAQVTAFRTKPALAAVPGTSNHGWGLAVDLCGGIHAAGTVQSAWMAANAARFGFVQPDWARPGGEKPEPWHWEFGHLA